MLIKFGVIYMTLTKPTNKTETETLKKENAQYSGEPNVRADLNVVRTEVEF